MINPKELGIYMNESDFDEKVCISQIFSDFAGIDIMS